ncbi:HAD family hydrolase [Streptomyces mirabilis]|uniref:Haloacid dehalogenase superfamily, subfamily IA, variant 1 with third motif having Dx(3-4)D or Dx(3-4)E n=1 Tax=Streptomyces mirabilis TaxID=68239 RepID=A0A1I2HD92_9ACTN|nr:haloacid dehalogenase superfamily, subfamily IA, variant 1 with third motif having Dx(3-4)D or Dx(3-4)E [Streptomyces mirabilis]
MISYEQGREKPDPQLFLKACADPGADPRATLMVGDNPIRDGGAAACGLRAYILPAEHRTGERGLTDVLLGATLSV